MFVSTRTPFLRRRPVRKLSGICNTNFAKEDSKTEFTVDSCENKKPPVKTEGKPMKKTPKT